MGTQRINSIVYNDGERQAQVQELAVEAILHIKVNGVAYTTTVRTPGADEALARGLLFTEGLYVDTTTEPTYRRILDPENGELACLEVEVEPEDILKKLENRRSAMASASCGLCGIREPEEVQIYGGPLQFSTKEQLKVEQIPMMMAQMEEQQLLFAATGGCHGAASFSSDATLQFSFEDVGRHNAVDKVIGALLQSGQLDDATYLCISGRISYEIVFKAYQAKIPFIAAVSAPTSLAVATAEQFGLCLLGFCRDNRFTVYANGDHILGIQP